MAVIGVVDSAMRRVVQRHLGLPKCLASASQCRNDGDVNNEPLAQAVAAPRAKLSVAAVRGCENGRRGDCYDAALLRERRSPA